MNTVYIKGYRGLVAVASTGLEHRVLGWSHITRDYTHVIGCASSHDEAVAIAHDVVESDVKLAA